ncbi:hypothetical protein ACLOJK_001864 [Asimina triloba]
MAMKSTVGWAPFQKKQQVVVFLFLLLFSISSVIALFFRAPSEPSCNCLPSMPASEAVRTTQRPGRGIHNPLDFMKSRLVLLVSHELSLSGNSANLYLFSSGTRDLKWR